MRRPPTARSGGRVAALAVTVALACVPIALPRAAAGVGPLPDCRLDDVRTDPRGYDDWSITLVDWILTLGRKYAPPDLVLVSDAGVAGGGLVREVAFADLRAMARAAANDGTPLSNVSAYRSYRQQKALFREYRKGYGFREAITFSARPGHSEHQLGLTIDFVSLGDTGLSNDWESTPTGAWMAENAWTYGWLMSYPKAKKALTCYRYEPWHYRYVGRELAQKIHDSGLTPREYLWANFTQVDLSGEGSPAPSGPMTSPDPRPTASPGAAAPSMGPAPIQTPGLAPVDVPGFLEALTPPVVAGAAILLGLLALLALRWLRRPRR